jgi:hypothetical protein
MSSLVVSLLFGIVILIAPVDIVSVCDDIEVASSVPSSVVVCSEGTPQNDEIRNSFEQRFEHRDPALRTPLRRLTRRFLETWSAPRIGVNGCYRSRILAGAAVGAAHSPWARICLEIDPVC